MDYPTIADLKAWLAPLDRFEVMVPAEGIERL